MNNMTIKEKRDRLLSILTKKSFNYSEEKIYKLASGNLSNYYINCKTTTLEPEGMNLIGEIIFDMISKLDISAIGGLTLGADPISFSVAMTSYQKGKPIKAFVVRKNAKAHGMKKWIEGNISDGERLVVIEDVITTGGSALEAIKKIKEENGVVVKVIALVDREEGGKEAIEKEGFPVGAVFTKSELMKMYKKS